MCVFFGIFLIQKYFVFVLAFTLEKENLETLEAIGYLASSLGVLPSDFSYAGIKDKKAITYQSVVVKKVTSARLFVIFFNYLYNTV